MATQRAQKTSFLDKVKKYRKEILVGLLGLLVLIFLVKNMDDVEFDLVFFKTDMPLIFLLLFFAAAGAGTVAIYWRMDNKDKKFRIRELEKELDNQQRNAKLKEPGQE
jgi:uncharacterized integral membrane protein